MRREARLPATEVTPSVRSTCAPTPDTDGARAAYRTTLHTADSAVRAVLCSTLWSRALQYPRLPASLSEMHVACCAPLRQPLCVCCAPLRSRLPFLLGVRAPAVPPYRLRAHACTPGPEWMQKKCERGRGQGGGAAWLMTRRAVGILVLTPPASWEPSMRCINDKRLGLFGEGRGRRVVPPQPIADACSVLAPPGDGGKWLCDPDCTLQPPCVIFSIGSENKARSQRFSRRHWLASHTWLARRLPTSPTPSLTSRRR